MPELRTTGLDRQSPFSFRCARCSACCRFKQIQVNPYEIARLARGRGLSTGELVARFTRFGGSCLAVDAEGRCVFFGPAGCTVHADRPLVCRLYPLGRHRDGFGRESFSEIAPDAGCAASREGSGTVDGWLQSQDAMPYIEAADRYFEVFLRLGASLLQADGSARGQIMETVKAHAAGSEYADVAELDMDAAVAQHCAARGIPVPGDLDVTMGLHLEVLARLAEG